MKSFVTICLLATCASAPAFAQSYGDGVESISILKGWRDADGTHIAAIDIQLEKHWKTYWRVASQGGIPPHLDWSMSSNIAGLEFVWPAPSIFEDYGIRTVGYANRVILPMRLKPKNPAQQITFQGRLDLGVCKDICIPVQHELNASLSRLLSFDRDLIEDAMTQVADQDASAFRISCEFTKTDDGFDISARVETEETLSRPALLFVEYDGGEWIAQGKTKRRKGALTNTASVFATDLNSIDPADVTLTVVERDRVREITGCS